MNSNSWKLGIKSLVRDYKGGELKVIALAVILAVVCFSAINFCNIKIKSTVSNLSAEMLGGDRFLSLFFPIQDEIKQVAEKNKIQMANSISFHSMVMAKDKLEFAEVRAVDDNYPLRGSIVVTAKSDFNKRQISHGPKLGNAWLEPRVAQSLGVRVGDSLCIGEKNFVIERLILTEPGNNSYFYSFAPRVMISIADLADTKIIKDGSKVAYEVTFSGDKSSLLALDKAVFPSLTPAQKYIEAHKTPGKIREILTKGTSFLQLVAIVNLIIAGSAVAIIGDRFALRHRKQIGVLRALGAADEQIAKIYFFILLLLGLITGSIGVLLGYSISELALAKFIPKALLYNSGNMVWTFFSGIIMAWLMLFVYALPVLLKLRKDSVSQVLIDTHLIPEAQIETEGLAVDNVVVKEYLAEPVATDKPTYNWLPGLVLLACISYGITEDYRLSTMLLLGFVALGVTVLIFAKVINQIVNKLKYLLPPLVRISCMALLRRSKRNSIQLIAFALLIAVVLFLYLVKTQLMGDWNKQLAAGTPNQFITNIMPSEVAGFHNFLQRKGVPVNTIYPVVKGRLVAINNESVEIDEGAGIRSYLNKRKGYHRALNLTWTAGLPVDNEVIQGKWFEPKQFIPEVSLSSGVARRLQVEVGDELTFKVDDEDVTAMITSIRKVQWDSLHPNFFVIYPPGMLNDLPHTYMTSIYVAKENLVLLAEIKQQFPSISMIDTTQIMQRLGDTLCFMLKIVSFLWTFTLVVAVILLQSVIASSLAERKRENIVLNLLGTSNARLFVVTIVEFLLKAGVSATIGVLFANLAARIIDKKVFALSFKWNLSLNIEVLIASTLAITLLAGINLLVAKKAFKGHVNYSF